MCFTFIGALGLTTRPDCDNSGVTRGAKIECYHRAAMTYAYLAYPDNPSGRPNQATLQEAINTCNAIWFDIGLNAANDDDLKIKADVETQNCFMDVAKITGNDQLCVNIRNFRGSASGSLAGETATRELCTDLARKTNDRFNYYSNNPSICSVLYVIPFFVLVYITHRKQV
ncbi:hypothetical protein HY990_05500 [Candidatus Micrarchaeota archaeon]|nr:hypothetical protein [Candidatus Micrarchaeota archaeon]